MSSKRLLAVSMAVAFLLPVLSWVLSALGVPCRSILDGEGLRWLFCHTGDCLRSRLVTCSFCMLLMQGTIRTSRILPLSRSFRQPRFWRMTAAYAVVFLGILVPAVLPDSPLLSITGGIVGSPLWQGLPFLGWFSFLVFCLCYGHDKRTPWHEMLTFGLRRFPLILPLAAAVSFCWQCVEYMMS